MYKIAMLPSSQQGYLLSTKIQAPKYPLTKYNVQDLDKNTTENQ